MQLFFTGSDTATPEVVNGTGIAGPCTPGSYCPEQSATPTECPLGTYSNSSKLSASTQCLNCTYGNYCGALGLTEPSGPCDPGFYCLIGAESANNAVEDETGKSFCLCIHSMLCFYNDLYRHYILYILYYNNNIYLFTNLSY